MRYAIYLIADVYGNKCDKLYIHSFSDINKAFQAIEQYYSEDLIEGVSKQRYEVRECNND